VADSTVDEKKKSPAQRAVDARPPFDGPHRKIKKTAGESSNGNDPAYVVVVKKDKSPDDAPDTAPLMYDPKELHAKARGLLANKNISSDQKRVLEEILGPEENKQTKNNKI